jgi:hypothetical protein
LSILWRDAVALGGIAWTRRSLNNGGAAASKCTLSVSVKSLYNEPFSERDVMSSNRTRLFWTEYFTSCRNFTILMLFLLLG